MMLTRCPLGLLPSPSSHPLIEKSRHHYTFEVGGSRRRGGGRTFIITSGIIVRPRIVVGML